MVSITVKFMSMVREKTGMYRAEFTTPSTRLYDVVREVVEKYGIEDLILTEKGTIRPWARVMLNGRSQDLSEDADIKLKEGDVIALVYSFPYHENV